MSTYVNAARRSDDTSIPETFDAYWLQKAVNLLGKKLYHDGI